MEKNDDASRENAILFLTGASSTEELDESEMEKFDFLSSHPVNLNTATRNKLSSLSLLSPFQIAVLMEEREEGGDILSYTELGLLDGFSAELADALRYFTCLGSVKEPRGGRMNSKFSLDVLGRLSWRFGSANPCPGVSLKASWGDRINFAWASRTTLSQPDFSLGTISASYSIGNFKFIAGDFNARFGQGVGLWSGFSLSGLSSVSSFVRNGSGLSECTSFSRTFRGGALVWTPGRFTVGAAYSFEGNLPIASISWYGRHLSVGALATDSNLSVDWRLCGRNLSFYGEIAYNYGGSPAGLAGIMWTPLYQLKIALLARYYPQNYRNPHSGAPRTSSKVSDEHGVSFAGGWRNIGLSADCRFKPSDGSMQYKAVLSAKERFEFHSLMFEPELKIQSRYSPCLKTVFRNDLRGGGTLGCCAHYLSFRYETVFGKGRSWLWFAELSHRGDTELRARFTLFKVDNWDDRIYVSEPDAPRNFSTPAYYGRGWSATLLAGRKFRTGRLEHSVYLRCRALQYPWNPVPKQGTVDLRLQYMISL